MALRPISTRYITKLICNYCGHIQDNIGVPTEHEGEKITYVCPACGIGELQYERLPVTEYVDEEDD